MGIVSLHRGVLSLQCGIEGFGCVAKRLIGRNRYSVPRLPDYKFVGCELEAEFLALSSKRLEMAIKERSSSLDFAEVSR